MKKYFPPILLLMLSSFACSAEKAPFLGDVKADSYQICGKEIKIQIRTMANGTIIIGLKNKKNNEIDLFRSVDATSTDLHYTKFINVKFDNLSKNFVVVDDYDLDIVWGRAFDENKKEIYNLALGSEVYKCSEIQIWPNEKANELYGE